MNRAYRALRTWFRGDGTILRKDVHLDVERLEERLAPAGDFRSVIGLDAVQNLYPYRGTGYTVAILDTGIDYNHADLGAGFGAGKRVVAGWDFVNNDANPMDDNGHGTHLAGIIGSSDAAAPGIAPNVQFVALKVLDANMNGSWANVDKALQWVIANQSKYNIVAINLSLGSGNYTTNPYALLENDFSSLKSMGVFTAVAAGNRYFTFNSQPGLSYPSISPNVVPVGATWAATSSTPVTFVSGAKESAPTVDHLLSTSQRSSALSLVAPGAWITSTWLNNGTQAMGGTSMATAVVAGSATLIHQAYDQTGKSAQATQDNILQLLKTTGVSIVDIDYGTDNVANTNLTFKRVNLKAAMDTIGQPVAPPTFAPIPNQTLPVGGTIVVPLKVTSPTGKPITFTWKQIYLPAQAYQLDQKHGFKYLGSYYQNSYGANEKWIIAANNIWHAILPNGEVRRWAGSMASTLTPANLVGTLDASYWSDPAKLWNAPYAGMPPAVFSLSGSNLSIRSPAFWLGTYRVVVTASDGTYQVQQGFNVNQVPANSAPVLSSIANQTMPHSQDKLTLNLSATDADQDPITFSAQVLPINGVTPAVSVSVQGNQLTVNPAASVVGTFTVQVNASDGKATTSKSFAVTVYNTAPTLGAIDDQTSSHGPETVLTLNGTDADGDVLTYSAQVLSVNGQTPPIQATINGNQLTLHATEPIVGTYAIATTVSDGAASATRAFNLILTNTGPTFAAVSPQTMANGQTSSTFTLPVNDADNDTLSFQAVVQTPDAAAYQLNQQYAFKASNASYYFNTQGASEKWVIDKNKFWYAIMPTGKVHRWNHSMTQTLTAANLVATLDPSVYAEPRLLWNANPPVTPPLTISFQGNQMTIERPASLTGVFFLDVTVSDGWLTAKRTIQVTLN